MRFKLKQLTQKTIKIAVHSKGSVKRKIEVSRKGVLCSGSGLIERDFRDHKVRLNRMPIDHKLVSDKLNDYIGTMHPMVEHWRNHSELEKAKRDYIDFKRKGFGEFTMPIITPICFDTDTPSQFKTTDFWHDSREPTKRPRLDND